MNVECYPDLNINIRSQFVILFFYACVHTLNIPLNKPWEKNIFIREKTHGYEFQLLDIGITVLKSVWRTFKVIDNVGI
jgi:hypothetical protein